MLSPAIGALGELLRTLVGKENGTERRALASFAPSVQPPFYNALVSNVAATGTSRQQLEGEVSLLLSMRLLWTLVPESIFSAFDPNYERVAVRSLERVGAADAATSCAAMLAIVYRRLRESVRVGRSHVTSLDLERPTHLELWQMQHGRCAICRYEFPRLTFDFPDENDLTYYKEQYASAPGELTLDTYYRRPVLDHILPYFLGGDGRENWQILCHSCNAGKGEALVWMGRRGWLPPMRVSDVTHLTASMRYAAMASNQHKLPTYEDCQGIVRVFKRDSDRLVLFDNLEIRMM